MKRTVGLVVACLALVAAGFSLAPTPPAQSELQREVERLRIEVAELKRRAGGGDFEGLRARVDDAHRKLDATMAYLNAEADAAAALLEALQDSEQKGFTFGINPDSRVALLAGFQAFCEGLQQNVPGRKPEEETPAAGR